MAKKSKPRPKPKKIPVRMGKAPSLDWLAANALGKPVDKPHLDTQAPFVRVDRAHTRWTAAAKSFSRSMGG